MAVNLSPVGGVAAQFFSNNGVPLAGGKIFTYAAGTTTPAATYTTSLGNVAWTNPIVLDAAGRVPGSGEIWLFDGTIYKFILKDSNDVLIATYDNITGINSNFVNFTAQQEIQTATAGQTVFDLTTMQYQPGTNSLTVYVDGVNQYGPGAQYAYLETDSDTVTFLSGLHVGASVKFTTTTQTSGNATDASVVAYTPPFTGSVTTTVEDKLAQTISVLDFGADPTGVTDSSSAVQAAIDEVADLGGNLYFPRGVYLFESQVTIDRTYAPSVGERNLLISGYGAEIRTTGAITAFDVKGGWSPNHNCTIEGFTIYHRGNTQAVGGIRMIGAGLVTCREVSVVVSSSLPAGYGAFMLENTDPADPDTGCFWCLIDQCTIRPWAGAEGYCDYGVKAIGAANALTLRNNTFSGSDIHVLLGPHTGETYSPNSVNIDGNFFEGPTSSRGIRLFSADPTYHVSGTRITNNRFEAILTAVLIEGAPSAVQLPTYMSGNYADTSVTNYVVNTSGVPIVMLDFDLVGAPMGPAKMQNQQGVVIENDNGAYNALTLKTPGLGKGLALRRQSGDVLLGTIAYSTAAGGLGMQLAGSYTPDYRPLTIKGCQGIAARDTAANNLAGTATFSASTSVAVTLPIAEPDANYLIFFDNSANQTLWVTSKSTTGFTINSSASNSTTVGWLLIRHL